MNKEQMIWIVVDKKTNKKEIMLINNWGIIPMFSKKKHALEFMREEMFPEDLKVVKFTIKEKLN